MKLRKNWKRFWTLDRHHAEGFTLVELIVVIAILAILGGVAIPAYSGYVAKAERAGDEQLLAAVNTAFAAACIESGVNILDLGVNNADIEIVDQKIDVTSVQPAAAQKSFELFYGDSKDSEFSVYTDIFFDPAIHAYAFEVPVTLTYNGVTITLSAKDIAALKDSTFLNAITLGGSDGLLDKVDFVTNIAAAMASGQMSTVFADPDFIACAMSALGAKTSEEYIAIQEDLLKEMMDGGLTREQAEAKLGANAAVLYASMNAVKFTDDQIGAIFSTTGVDEIKANLTTTGKTTDGMGQAALVYGMYTAYAHSTEYGNAELQATTDDPIAVIKALENDENFKTYANSAQGKKDLEAYLGALNMISDSANSNPDAVKHLMVNGFNNQEMKDVIAGVTE